MLLAQPPSATARRHPPDPPPHTRPRAANRKHAAIPWERASVTVRAVAGGLQIDRNGGFMSKPCLTMSSYARLLSREDRSAARALLLQT
jgi:hypothetical protein